METKTVIDSLHAVVGNVDMLRQLVLQMAANTPEEFMKAFEKLDFSNETLKMRVNNVLKNLPNYNYERTIKIERIKACRTLTGFGLKESKEWVEANYSDNGSGV